MAMRVEGERLLIEGNLDAFTVPGLFESSLAGVRNGVTSVDFAQVGTADSSAIALALAIWREAETAGRKIHFLNVPPTMLKLARLYAVDELLGTAPA